jgi:16S rRNA processing protein RimM
MISKTEVFPIGHFYKTHGLNGELGFSFTSDVFDRTESPYWVLDMDGIFVPFFVETYRFRSDSSALVILSGIDDEMKARLLVGKTVYYPVSYDDDIDDETINTDILIGYKVIDEVNGDLGEIKAVDDSTLNVLIMVSDGEREILIPVAGGFLTNLDNDKKVMYVSLPQDLIDL